MRVQIHSIHFDASAELQDFIRKRIDKLTTFYDGIVDAEVFLRLTKGEHTRENKGVEIKLNVPGTVLVAGEVSTSFEESTDEAVEKLRRQIRKYKEKALAKP